MESLTSPWSINTTEDSGFASGSINHTSPNLMPSLGYESTPNISWASGHSRKRKLCQFLGQITPTLTHSSSSAKRGGIISSTLNESTISRSLERCNLSSFTPNFYIERQESPKKKPRSEPTTPTKQDGQTEFYRLHTDSFQKTPTKCTSLQRLGSPESNEILYSGEIRAVNPLKLEAFKRQHSPAKKRLFRADALERLTRPHVKVDPVRFFSKDRNIGDIVEKIVSYLTDKDLGSFVRVSKDWKRAIFKDDCALKRLQEYNKSVQCNKENQYRRMSCVSSCISSPVKTDGPYFTVGSHLKEGQRRNKCPRCMHSAIVEKSISQCPRDSCGYIYCLECDSFSITGPENFQDRCMQSGLVLPQTARKSRLTESPKRDHMEPLSFLLDFGSPRYDSSGYSTDLEISPVVRRDDVKPRTSIVLGDCNRELSSGRASTGRRNSLVPVVALKHQKREEVMEPSSPPKIKNVACSAGSKRFLKRLIRQ